MLREGESSFVSNFGLYSRKTAGAISSEAKVARRQRYVRQTPGPAVKKVAQQWNEIDDDEDGATFMLSQMRSFEDYSKDSRLLTATFDQQQ